MGYFSIVHWLIVLAVVAVMTIPVWKILKRLGLNPWLSLLYLIPLVGLLATWWLAYAKWPGVSEKSETPA